ncbi:phage tail tube protein [Catenuloplanes japonicus]|uniref:phage tail tube protein n=1 Tax=Catenuloplanes japonicus TaxID=33876 RepID=UPI0005241083|nr:hypothetical protein [Catenuloplanes japonicus]
MVDVSLIRAYTDGLVATSVEGGSFTLPTNASSPLPSGANPVGAISEDGISEATSQDRTDVFVWQKNALARRIPGQASKVFTFAAAETNLTTLGIQYSGSVITQTSEGVSVAERPPGTDVRPWVLHGIDGNRALRLVVPSGEVTNRGDVLWSAGGITVYEWELSAYMDVNGFWVYRYYLDDDLAL